jgi:hypothetical protein
MSGVTSAARLRRDLDEDARRVTANRARCPRAVAIEALLIVALDHERELPPEDQMPLPARGYLESIALDVSDAIRRGIEASEHYQAEVIAYLHEHVRDPEALMRKVAERVGH